MRTLLLTLTTCLFVLPAQAKYSGGSGEPNDPYQIATAADLIALGETPEDYDKHFLLTADIDLDPNLPGRKIFDGALIAPGSRAREYPHPVLGTPFTGVFDGNRHTISHLTIEGRYDLGLFGKLEGEVKNLGVVDVNIAGIGDDYVGGLAGYSRYGNITRCYSTGEVSGYSHVGGLVGKNLGDVIECHSSNTVVGTGRLDTAWGDSGGVGGLVGTNTGIVASCHSDSAVTGHREVGGLVGLGGGIVRSYSAGAVSGVWEVGGLVGRGGATACFWDTQTSGQTTSDGGTGKTTAEMQTAKTFLDAGWDFVGEMVNGSDDIWKIGEGLGYPRLSWEKYSGGTGEPNDPYQIATAADLIALGETPEDYDKHFLLTADIDLDPNLPGRKAFDKAVIAPDTDTDPNTWSDPFTGVFDGKGHNILNLTINGGNHLGLFGRLRFGGELTNLGVVDVKIASSDNCVGGLVGDNYDGHVSRCYSTGVIRGDDYVGGLAGANARGNVTQCYSTTVATGLDRVGGLVGDNRGRLTDCFGSGAVSGNHCVGGPVGCNSRSSRSRGYIANSYSTGTVGGGYDVGGLVGANSSDVTQCYSSGVVSGTGDRVGGLVGHGLGSATTCFWDIETSGQSTSDGGTGKTTAEMQTASTFLDAMWDFADETANGTEDIWWILEGKDYPRLWWEATSE